MDDVTEEVILEEDVHEEYEENLEDKEGRRAEEIFASFFGKGTEEEQLRIRELAAKLGIRDNDAIWIIIYVFNYFGRFYNSLPEKIKSAADECIETVKKAAAAVSEAEVRKAQSLFAETLQRTAEEIISKHMGKSWPELLLPLAWSCMGVFMLCLISFVGGAASSGVIWGDSAITSILAAPAGWIIPLELIPIGGFSLYRGLTDSDRRSKLTNLSVSAFIAVTVIFVLSYVL